MGKMRLFYKEIKPGRWLDPLVVMRTGKLSDVLEIYVLTW